MQIVKSDGGARQASTHRDLLQAAYYSLSDVHDRLGNWSQKEKQEKRIKYKRDAYDASIRLSYLRPDGTIRDPVSRARWLKRADRFYQALSTRYAHGWKERESLVEIIVKTLNSLSPVWGQAEVELLQEGLRKTSSAFVNEATCDRIVKFIEPLLERLCDELLDCEPPTVEAEASRVDAPASSAPGNSANGCSVLAQHDSEIEAESDQASAIDPARKRVKNAAMTNDQIEAVLANAPVISRERAGRLLNVKDRRLRSLVQKGSIEQTAAGLITTASIRKYLLHPKEIRQPSAVSGTHRR